MEVFADRVTVLSDTVERADDIDMDRAQAARERAPDYLLLPIVVRWVGTDFSRMEAALRRATVRITR